MTLAAVATVTLTTAAAAQARTPIRDCGDLGGEPTAGSAYAITAQGPTLRVQARAVAPDRAGQERSAGPRPRVVGPWRGYDTASVAPGPQGALPRPLRERRETRFIRFEYGS